MVCKIHYRGQGLQRGSLLFFLPILQEKLGNPNIGLYRDNGLGAMHNLNARASDRKRKDITETFKNLGLKITIEASLKTVNFLDVTLDLGNESYKPYRKPSDNPLYINASSNHPPSILKQLPKNISKRVSGISSSKEIFDQAAPYYNDALKASGYREKIEFQPPETAAKQESQKRKRKVIWFNPPYSMNVKTNIAKKSFNSWTSTSPSTIIYTRHLIETTSRSATAACQTPQASLRPTTKESSKTNTPPPPLNATVERKRSAP